MGGYIHNEKTMDRLCSMQIYKGLKGYFLAQLTLFKPYSDFECVCYYNVIMNMNWLGLKNNG